MVFKRHLQNQFYFSPFRSCSSSPLTSWWWSEKHLTLWKWLGDSPTLPTDGHLNIVKFIAFTISIICMIVSKVLKHQPLKRWAMKYSWVYWNGIIDWGRRLTGWRGRGRRGRIIFLLISVKDSPESLILHDVGISRILLLLLLFLGSGKEEPAIIRRNSSSRNLITYFYPPSVYSTSYWILVSGVVFHCLYLPLTFWKPPLLIGSRWVKCAPSFCNAVKSKKTIWELICYNCFATLRRGYPFGSSSVGPTKN